MLGPQMALVLGALLLVLGFAVGVGPVSASVADQTHHCGGVIQPGWLASGTPRGPVAEASGTPDERRLAARVDARCDTAMTRAAWLTWGSLGLGAITGLLGWTALRERAHPLTARAKDPISA